MLLDCGTGGGLLFFSNVGSGASLSASSFLNVQKGRETPWGCCLTVAQVEAASSSIIRVWLLTACVLSFFF